MKYNWILVLARIRGMDKEILFINEFQQSVYPTLDKKYNVHIESYLRTNFHFDHWFKLFIVAWGIFSWKSKT